MTSTDLHYNPLKATVRSRTMRSSKPSATNVLSPHQLIMLVSLCIFVLLGLSKPTLLLAGVIRYDDASTLRQAGYGAITLIALIAAQPVGRWKRILCVPWPFVVAICWFAFSILWSPVPVISLSRLGITAIVIWLAFLCPDRLGATRSIVALRIVLGAWLLFNYIAVIAIPKIGIHNFVENGLLGQWRGWMAHKNFAGTAAAITLLFGIFPGGERRTWLPRLVLTLGALPMLVFSQSRAAIIGAFVATMVGVGIVRFGRRLNGRLFDQAYKILLIISAAIVVIIIIVAWNPDIINRLLDDPKELSGRTQIWQALIVSFSENPLFGTGYAAFWNSNIATEPNVVRTGWQGISTGHNGYIDIAVQTGLIGLLISLGAVFLWSWLRVIRLSAAMPALTGLTGALLSFALVNNFAESSLFEGDQIPQLFLLIGLGLLQVAARRGQRMHSIELGRVRTRRSQPEDDCCGESDGGENAVGYRS